MTKRKNDFSEKLNRVGMGNLAASLLMTIFFVSLSILYYVFLQSSMKDNIVNEDIIVAKESISLYERYLTRGMDIIEYESSQVRDMVNAHASHDDILQHMTYATNIIIEKIDDDSTGLYGYIDGEYYDGAGWVPDADYDPTARPWYQAAMMNRGRLTFVDPYLDAQTGTVMMTLAHTLADSSNVVALDMSLKEIQSITIDLSEPENGQTLMLVDSKGSVIAHPDQKLLGINYHDMGGDLNGFIINLVMRGNTGYFETMYGGEQYMVYAEQLGGYWYCISVTEAGDSFRILHILLGITMIVVLATLFIFSVLFLNLTQGKANTDTLSIRLQTAADIYMSMHDIDIVNDRIYPIKTNESERREVEHEDLEHAQQTMYDVMSVLADDMSVKMIHEFLTLSTLDERMADTNTISIEFLNHKNKWCRARFIVSEKDETGRITHVMLCFEQIDAEKRSRDKLLYMSETDSMTGISNRGSGEHKIKEQMSNGVGGMFIMIDIDKFKSINDTFGHGVGDTVIIAVAQVIKNAFRSSDTVMRLGGDEFAAYAKGVYDKESAADIIGRLMKSIEEISIPELGDRRITVSAGVSFYRKTDSFSFDELYKRTDRCTYDSKEHQGNYVTYYGG